MHCWLGCGGRCCLSESRCLSGHLELVCDLDSRGLTRLRHQSFRPPIHLSKPHHDAGVQVVNMINPTAGLLEGDQLRMDVQVEPGAHLLLTSPSSTRVHTMKTGHAEVTGRFQVRAGGSLDWWPEFLIPQAGANYQQEMELEVEPGGEMLFFESIAPGRTAMKEVFAYRELRWATDLRVGGRLLARERCCLRPEEAAVAALRRQFPEAYFASALLVSPRFEKQSACWGALQALHHGNVWSGVSALGEGTYAWKIVAGESLGFRHALREGRRAIYATLARPLPSLRRDGWE